jgi:hypothetical protein
VGEGVKVGGIGVWVGKSATTGGVLVPEALGLPAGAIGVAVEALGDNKVWLKSTLPTKYPITAKPATTIADKISICLRCIDSPQANYI